MHRFKLIFFVFLLLFMGTKILAQKFNIAKDSAIIVACAKTPEAASQNTLSFSAKAFDFDYKEQDNSQEEASESIETLLDNLEKDPLDLSIALRITELYREAKDEKNYYTYLEYSFNHAKKSYIAYPDSFELVSQFSKLLQQAKNMKGSLGIWNKYIMDNPRDVRGLTQFIERLAIQGQVEKAWHFTKQAYELEPKNPAVYFSAFLCEFTNVLIQFKNILQKEGDSNAQREAFNQIKIDDTFLKKAIENGAPIEAQMSIDASQMLIIFYRTMLQLADFDLGEEKINITPNASDLKMLKEIEKRSKKLLQKKVKNLFFPYKVLFTIECLRGNKSKAIAYWKNSGKFLKKDAESLRMISFTHILDLDFANAAFYLEKKLKTANDYEDSYALGRIHIYNNDLENAFDVFGKTIPLNPLDRRAICAQISILIKQHKFDEAVALMNGFSSEETDNIEAFHANYYKALCCLIQGDKADAYKRLNSIHKESEYKKKANELLGYFLKNDKSD